MTEERTNYVNIAAGLCFVGLGVLLLLQASGTIQLRLILQLWPVALILIGGAVVVQSLRGGPTSGGAPVGGLVWLVLLGVLFGHVYERRDQGPPPGSGQINMFAVLSGNQRPPITGDFHGGQITTVMGGTNLDLRHAQLAPGETAVVDLFTVMGGAEIRVPDTWAVDVEAMTIMGGVKDERGAPARALSSDPSVPHIVLKGTIVMGGINVKS